MAPGDWAFVALAVNPVGGILVAIPFGVFELGYPPWLAALASIPLAYVQVLVIDLGWTALVRWGAWNRLLARLRSRRVERLMAAGGSFWTTLLFTPLLGPWVVMAFMRYAQVPQRRVAAPIVLGIAAAASATAILCLVAPTLLGR